MTATDIALVVDNREQLGGAPGLHAFIIGVSDYPYLPPPDPGNRADMAPPHFGLRKLASPALSACRIARALSLWNPTLAAPLATVRLLLAPSAEEKLAGHTLAVRAPRPTWDNFARAAADWRADMGSHNENVGLFYFGGHGVQRTLNDQILLLEGFGDGIGGALRHGVDTQRLVRGMAPAPDQPEMGRRQLFLFDACRFSPPDMMQRDIEQVADIWPIPDTFDDDRNCTILYATAPGRLSYATRGRSTVFARAFINAMNREGAQEEKGLISRKGRSWSVRATTLASSIAELVKLDPAPFRGEQSIFPAGARPEFVLRTLPRAPRFKILLRLQPAADHKRAKLLLQNDRFDVVGRSDAPISPYPYRSRLRGGIYVARLELCAKSGKPHYEAMHSIMVGPFSGEFVFDTSD